MGVQALADMSDVERKLALERYKLLEPHLQNGRELRSVSKGSDVVLLIIWHIIVRIIWHTIVPGALADPSDAENFCRNWHSVYFSPPIRGRCAK